MTNVKRVTRRKKDENIGDVPRRTAGHTRVVSVFQDMPVNITQKGLNAKVNQSIFNSIAENLTHINDFLRQIISVQDNYNHFFDRVLKRFMQAH